MGSAVPFTVRSCATKPGAEEEDSGHTLWAGRRRMLESGEHAGHRVRAADVRTPVAKKVRRSNGFTRSPAPVEYCGRCKERRPTLTP